MCAAPSVLSWGNARKGMAGCSRLAHLRGSGSFKYTQVRQRVMRAVSRCTLHVVLASCSFTLR